VDGFCTDIAINQRTYFGEMMAGMDKLYGTKSQRMELFKWCSQNKPELMVLFYKRDKEELDGYSDDCEFCIGNFGVSNLNWLSKNCPIEWVKEHAKDNIELFVALFGKEHLEDENE
jgi:hypothetical protein